MGKTWKDYDYTTVNLPTDLINEVDKYFKKAGLKTRAEFIRSAIQYKLFMDDLLKKYHEEGFKFEEETEEVLSEKMYMTIATLDKLLEALKTPKNKPIKQKIKK